MREILTDVVTTTAMAVFAAGFCIICRNVQVIAGNWLDKMRDEAENEDREVTARMFETASQLLSGITYNAVAAMEQTKAKDIRERVKAGLEDRSKLTILAKDVLYSVKEQLAPDVTRTLEQYITDLDSYIASQIEACLLGIKGMPGAQLAVALPEYTLDSPENAGILPEAGEV